MISTRSERERSWRGRHGVGVVLTWRSLSVTSFPLLSKKHASLRSFSAVDLISCLLHLWEDPVYTT
jgi:hypothetical protein